MHPQPRVALADIYREHFDFVWNVLRRLGVDPRDLEDVSQEVFLVVHRRLEDFEGRSSIKTWLYAIAVRLALNYNRRRRNRPLVAESSSSGLPAPSRHADPEDFAARSEAETILLGLLGELDPDKRVAFVLSEIEGLPAHEIGKMVGANTRTVYSRLRAARERFAVGLQRTRARDERWRTRDLVRRAGPRAPARSRDTVWAALVLRWGEAAVPSTMAPIGLTWLVKSAMATVSLAAAGLGVVAVVTLPFRASVETPAAQATSPVAARGDPTPQSQTPAEAATPASDPEFEVAAGEGGEPSATLAVAPRRSRSPSASGSPPDALEIAQSSEDALRAEVDLMRRARSALADGDASEALRLLDRHAAEYPEGALERDRDRTRITALCRLGRADEARRLAGDPTLRCASS